MKYILFVFLLAAACNSVYAQHIIQGNIKDNVTHKPVSYASVGIKGTTWGTITNDEGDFTISAPVLPVTITISHVSYEPVEISNIGNQPVNILLKTRSTKLREVIIGDEALVIMRRAAKRATQNADSVYDTHIFFRQSVSTRKKLNFFAESFIDAQWQNSGLTKYNITNSRYLEQEGGITNRNMAALCLLSSGFTKNSAVTPGIQFPINHRPDSLYKFTLKGRFESNGRPIVIINCELKKTDDEQSAFIGDYYIDTQSYGVVKTDGTIVNFKLSSPNYSVFVDEVKFISQYKFIRADINVLDYFSFSLKATYSPGAFRALPVMLNATVYALDYQPVSHSKLVPVTIKRLESDQERFKRARYATEFWQQNEIIKRTPQENAAVAELEKNKTATGNLNIEN